MVIGDNLIELPLSNACMVTTLLQAVLLHRFLVV